MRSSSAINRDAERQRRLRSFVTAVEKRIQLDREELETHTFLLRLGLLRSEGDPLRTEALNAYETNNIFA